MYFTLQYIRIRAYLKNHSHNLHAPLCGIFYPHSVAVARYAALIRIKSPTNWDSQLTKSLFQTRSSMDRYKIGSGTLSLIMERYHAGGIPIEELQMMPPKEVELLFYPQKNIKDRKSVV